MEGRQPSKLFYVGSSPTGNTNSKLRKGLFLFVRINMKKHNKKIKAKIELLKLAEEHAFLQERKKLAKIVKAIGDEELQILVDSFVLAKEELELYLENIQAEVALHLPDDSDF